MNKKMQNITCSCGQENQLVLLEDGWHFDEQRHGNGEIWQGRCFNCCAALSLPDEVEETVIESEPEINEPASKSARGRKK